MATLTIRLSDEKHVRLRQLAEPRRIRLELGELGIEPWMACLRIS
ncbi:MAG TPA: hypothetical protein VEW48_11590 [Thermoanaerobaculia bacterium]|nr:hypothetical protein [Thermoanaerobaculia bacterium]